MLGKLIKKLLIDRRENRHSRNIIHDLLTGQLDFTSKPKLPHKVACLLMQDCAADWAADAVIHKLLVDCKYNRKVDAIIGQLENTGTYVCQRNEGCETESKRMSQKFGEVVDRIASEDFGRSIVKACCTKERLRKGNVDEILDDLEDSIDECIERLLPVHQSFPGHPHGTSQM
ncbi:hypothetical protein HK101_002403 [Irineochytrium annulatum]|nr:hypothetical protein HK101_002403 [Irineochytrium annulatum]